MDWIFIPAYFFAIHDRTKPIVSVALMMLYEEGKFQLNDPVKLWLGPKWGRKRMRVFVRGGTPDAYELVVILLSTFLD